MYRVPALAVLSLPLFLAACSEGGASHCVPGNSVSCACTDGKMGSQTCNEGGTFEACRCSGTTADPPGSNDMGGSSSGPKRVFVTSVKYKANAVRAVCQGVADSQSLGGTWKPWLSGLSPSGPGGQTSAIGRILSNGPWMLLTGEVVFRNRGQLSTQPETAIRVTETKSTVPLNEYAWTGTILGGAGSGHDCAGWTSGSLSSEGTVGNPNSIQAWTDGGQETCDKSLHVYCFED